MSEGDTLFLAVDRSRILYFIVAPQGSTSERQLSWLFNLEPRGRTFVSREFIDDDPELDFAARFILDEIGVELEDPEADKLDSIIEPYGTTFPTTVEFSQRARLTLPDVRAEDDADAALLAWLTHEEALFRRLERRIVSARIEEGFVDDEGTDVDGFIRFSLSVQNRRKGPNGPLVGESLGGSISGVQNFVCPWCRYGKPPQTGLSVPELGSVQGCACYGRGMSGHAGRQINMQGALEAGIDGGSENTEEAPSDSGTRHFEQADGSDERRKSTTRCAGRDSR